MKIKFWGVRGSIPTPMNQAQLQGRIAAIVQRIQPSDLVSQESRDIFIAGLPAYLSEIIGGNTTCIEIRPSDDTCIIIDAGTGIRTFGNDLLKRREKIKKFHIFFTHFHMDHITGLPFFEPAYKEGTEIHFYSPQKHMEKAINEQIRLPYFPVTLDAFMAKMYFHYLKESPVNIGTAQITWRGVKHPGGCFSYKITENNKSFIFSTDTELIQRDFRRNEENTKFYKGIEFIVIDSQYTLSESIEKIDWGHSSNSLVVDFALSWDIPKIIFFHHEPKHEDMMIYKMLKTAKWYKDRVKSSRLEIGVAKEEMEIEL
ncbi:MAG: MBL fold metallo-hydrolase [Spirochaetales bacterium]|nr:MBL fold metallo-hydrolase [Spirochaetales bacterium]